MSTQIELACVYMERERFAKPFMPETAPKTVIRQAQGLETVSKVKFTSKGDVNYVPPP